MIPLLRCLRGLDLTVVTSEIGIVLAGVGTEIADVTPVELRGTAFGLRQSMDTVGAFLGPMLAMLMMAATAGDFRFAFWIAVIPAALAVLLILYGVREPTTPREGERRRFPVRRAELARLGIEYWWLVAVATVLTLGRFSEAFLLLAAQHAGMALSLIPAVLVLMNVTYAASAYPVGRLADRMSRHSLLVIGIILLIAADILLATAGNVWQVMAGAAVWGLHMGATQGLLSAIVADIVPADLRGTAFGLYSLITGAAMLAASLIAGSLWTAVGPAAAFTAGATFAVLSIIGLTLRRTNTPA
jgi:MFS family permease